MTTKKLVPRASGEGAMGVTDNAWGEAYYDTGNFNKGLFVKGSGIEDVIANTVTQGGLGGEWTRNGLDIYYNGGNVGIGTASPGAKLDVADSEAPTIHLTEKTSNYSSRIGIPSAAGQVFSSDAIPGSLAIRNDTKIQLGGVTPLVTINGAEGNVGIGTASPGTKLDVNGVGRFLAPNGGSALCSFAVGATTGVNQPVFALVTNELNNEDRVRFNSDGHSWFNGGNVGIGTRDPDSKLHLSTVGTDGLRLGVDSQTYYHMIRPNGDGLYLGADDGNTGGVGADIRFSVKGDEKMRIDSAGNVGIGTADPSGPLDVVVGGGAVTVSTNGHITSKQTLDIVTAGGRFVGSSSRGVLGRIQIEQAATGADGGYMCFGTSADGSTSPTERMRITSAGNVGIGNTNPSHDLTIGSATDPGTTEQRLKIYRGIDDPGQNLEMGYRSIILTRADLLANNQSTFSIWQKGSDDERNVFHIDPAGKVGIGTANPDAILSVAGGAGHPGIKYTSGTANNVLALDIGFANGGTGLVVKNTNGNVGIGTTDPSSALSVYRENTGAPDTTFASIEVLTKNTDTAANLKTGWLTQIGCYSLMNANGALPSKNALIGVYRDSAGSNEAAVLRLSRSGQSSDQYFWVDDAGKFRTALSSSSAGSNTLGTVVGDQTSDERIKNIEDSFEYGLSDILKLKPIAFTFKEQKDDSRKLGFGAQSVQPIIPESVYDSKECLDGYDPDPEDESGTRQIPKSDKTKLVMEYTQLIPVLTKAIQEQQQLIEDLRSEVEALKNK